MISWSYSMLFHHVVLEKAEDGWIIAECPSLPGCVSQGRDEKEAMENIKEAIIAWLWAEDQKVGSHVVMTKSGIRVNLSVPQHKEISIKPF